MTPRPSDPVETPAAASRTSGCVLRLPTDIPSRYGSLDAFPTQVHLEFDCPTQELPRFGAHRSRTDF
ncbi:hypothetical protein NSK11_contig00119-0005 [Nocardia seriolae]|uniref:Uncharacterized protein n=1 Tax=Nocardia seriolae TaxID=37332 RepID=A0ABC9Z1N0_9NOCA|nr:hypothetical protein NSERKGN1266_54280 [Nocardia seriolae]BEK94907.1 hypothetical protein NSER024013_28130 [Nocardia seriolae]GAM49630.1 hypothetical protein NS07_v2contig00116-0027 [Nocardia seriolae]GAP31569.1 hypothetical protein NSK11_contig00119-0005 [Nocardia seriolae]GEM27239.1 hypothetical protein NS2_54780 [Nocardia seriolae NBRC 15557]